MCQNEDKNPSTEDSVIQQKTELTDGGGGEGGLGL